MKELKSIEHSNYREILGKVTLKNKNIFKRSQNILVTDETNVPSGYKAVITDRKELKTSSPLIVVDNIKEFTEGDVVNIDTGGRIIWLYEIMSTSNAIFATARCKYCIRGRPLY